MYRESARSYRGFTLIELMIVVLVVTILATIAYPLYLSQVRHARRVDAKSTLKKAVNRGEQFYAQVHHYPQNLASINVDKTTDNKAYTVSADSSVSGFKVIANARGDQTNDACTQYTLRANGQQSSSDPGNCW